MYLAEGTVNGIKFEEFIRSSLLPILKPFDWNSKHSIVIMDNAYYYVENVYELIENQADPKLIYLPPYSLNLNPIEEVFSQG